MRPRDALEGEAIEGIDVINESDTLQLGRTRANSALKY
jgi:hypothetical protein